MKYRLLPRLRIVVGDGTIVLGPGKADLFVAVKQTGSIRDAAARLGMSYMRAWSLIRVMNTHFYRPLVMTSRGGSSGGGAMLTTEGRAVLRLYRRMSAVSARASERELLEILRKLALTQRYT